MIRATPARAASDGPGRYCMRILLLPGIWPPDVGGPATHGPDFARFLVDAGTPFGSSRWPTVRPPSGRARSRPSRARYPFPVRYSMLAARRAARGRRPTWSTRRRRTRPPRRLRDGASGRSSRSSSPTRPTSARTATGSFAGRSRSSRRRRARSSDALRRGADAALRRARTIVVPSEYLARIARGFGVDAGRVLGRVEPRARRASARAAEPQPNTFVYAGRLTAQKALGDRDRRDRRAFPRRSWS